MIRHGQHLLNRFLFLFQPSCPHRLEAQVLRRLRKLHQECDLLRRRMEESG